MDYRTFIGIDPSINHTAIVVLDAAGTMKDFSVFDDRKRAVEKDSHLIMSIKPDGTEKGKILRWESLVTEIVLRIRKYQLDGSLVGIEGYSFSSKGPVFDIAEFIGLLKQTMKRMMQDFIVFPPMTVKKYATGKGNAVKSQMVLAVYKRWSVEFSQYGDRQEDLCDAYAMACLAMDYCKFRDGEQFNKATTELLQKITPESIVTWLPESTL